MQGSFGATGDELEHYEQLGFFTRERIFSPAELAELQEAAERVHRRVLEEIGRASCRERV